MFCGLSSTLGRSARARGEVPEGRAGHSLAALGGEIPGRAGLSRDSCPDFAAQVARVPPKKRHGTERRGAPYVTHSKK